MMKKTEKKVLEEKNDQKNVELNWIYIVFGVLILILFGLLIYTLRSKNDHLKARTDDVSVEIIEQPRAQATPQGTTTFCLRLNGREDMHLPALLGAAGDNIYPNGLAGFNWSLSPTSTGDEPYGILPDGTIFIKKDFLERWSPNLVEIKSDLTGWAPVKLTLDKVNEEPAYIYKR